MNKYFFSLSLAIILAGLILVGCNKETTEVQLPTDTEYLAQQVTSADSLAEFLDSEDITLNDESEKDFDYDDFIMMKPDTTITPLRWGRKIENVTKTVLVQFLSDTIAIANVHKVITGKFIVKGITSAGDTIKVQKPYTTNSDRKIRFRKIAFTNNPKKNWIPVAMTLVQGQTASANYGISQLEVYTSTDTALVTDPLTYWFRMMPWKGGVMVFHPGDTVRIRLTVTSPNDSAEYVVVRHGALKMGNVHKEIRSRMRLISETGTSGAFTRVYEKKFITHLPMGVGFARFHALVDVMSYNSINDDTAPFMNIFWGVPYIVRAL
jgi:hypothetical protein